MQDTNKKNIVIITLIVVVVVLLICCICLFIKDEHLEDKYDNDSYDYSNVENNSNNYISKEEALDIALKDIKVNRSDIYDLDIELKRKYNKVLYEIDFDYKNHEYEYYINPIDGSIFKSFKERD